MVRNVEPTKRIKIGDVKPTKRNAIDNVEPPGKNLWLAALIFLCPKSHLPICLSLSYLFT